MLVSTLLSQWVLVSFEKHCHNSSWRWFCDFSGIFDAWWHQFMKVIFRVSWLVGPPPIPCPLCDWYTASALRFIYVYIDVCINIQTHLFVWLCTCVCTYMDTCKHICIFSIYGTLRHGWVDTLNTRYSHQGMRGHERIQISHHQLHWSILR